MSFPQYATREDVKHALDYKETARNSSQIDRILDDASRSIESLCHRDFYPSNATRYKDWPNQQRARSWRLWLDRDELISVSALVAGGTTIPSTDYFLRPDTGPPYTHIEIDLDSSSAFSAGNTHQRAIAITGVFGYGTVSVPAGALAEVLDSSETGVDVTNSAVVGVGDLILIESERMIVTDKSMLDTGQNCTVLTASAADVSITGVTSGSVFRDEIILVDSERMRVVDVAGTTVTVKRAFDGSVLATHSNGADIYALRTLTVERGAVGTTAVSHSTATAIGRHAVPGPVRGLCIAEAVAQLIDESTGYAATQRTGENSERKVSRTALQERRDRVYSSHGRKVRSRAV